MNFVLISIIIGSICLCLITANNSTVCHEMWVNKTTLSNCFNTTACCYYEYSFQNKVFKLCTTKQNDTEDICNQYNGVLSSYGASLDECNCSIKYLALNLILLLFIILLNI